MCSYCKIGGGTRDADKRDDNHEIGSESADLGGEVPEGISDTHTHGYTCTCTCTSTLDCYLHTIISIPGNKAKDRQCGGLESRGGDDPANDNLEDPFNIGDFGDIGDISDFGDIGRIGSIGDFSGTGGSYMVIICS